MEILDVHHPLVLVFGILGNLFTTGIYFAPIGTFIKIWKEKSSMEYESLGYVVTLFSALIWLYYAFIKGGDTAFLLITVNTLGIFVESFYLFIFLLYSPPLTKKKTYKVISSVVVVCIVIYVGTWFCFKGPTRVIVVGWICVATSLSVFAAPLAIFCKVVKTNNAELMPLPLSLFLTLSAMMWFAYGLFIMDICVMVPNAVGFVLGAIQMALYIYYKNNSSKAPRSREIKLPQHIVNITIVSNISEINTIDSGGDGEVEDEACGIKQ